MKVALDAMGGDYSPKVTVAGAVDFVKNYEGTDVILVGDETAVAKELEGKKYPKDRLTVVHASQTIGMDEQPGVAIRKKKDSSLAVAVDLVKKGEADAVLSAGNSGATMGLALLKFGKLPGVDRPAISTVIPVFRQPFVLLDAGAVVDCNPENLLQFAYMGSVYSRLVLERENPKVALLSIGSEPGKGNELTKEAYKLLEASSLNFKGNIEAKDIFSGRADVVVCDGFAGNVLLKASEGVAEGTLQMLKREIVKLMAGRLGYMLLKPAIDNFKRMTDYAEYGAAPLLGLNGNCLISHGRSSHIAIRNAIRAASNFASKHVQEAIAENLSSAKKSAGSTVATG